MTEWVFKKPWFEVSLLVKFDHISKQSIPKIIIKVIERSSNMAEIKACLIFLHPISQLMTHSAARKEGWGGGWGKNGLKKCFNIGLF